MVVDVMNSSELLSMKKQIRANCRKAVKVDFAAIQRYAVARHEDTLMKLMELAHEIENANDIWFPANVTWNELGDNVLENPITGVKARFIKRDDQARRYAWVWVRGKIQFFFDLKTNTCLFVTVREKYKKDEYDSSGSGGWKSYKYIPWTGTDDNLLNLSDMVGTPCVENYFPKVHLTFLSEHQKLVEQVETDYDQALKCKEALELAFEDIGKASNEYMNLANELMAKSKKGKAKNG